MGTFQFKLHFCGVAPLHQNRGESGGEYSGAGAENEIGDAGGTAKTVSVPGKMANSSGKNFEMPRPDIKMNSTYENDTVFGFSKSANIYLWY